MRAGLVAAALAAGILATPPGARAEDAIAVVVGRDSAVRTTSTDDLREIYLRRRRVWPDGRAVIPVNLPPDSAVRQRFSRLVLGRDVADLVPYWNARYFEGVTPPAVLPSPAAVRAYVAAEPSAIGYVPASEVDETCRTLLVLGR